MHDYPRFQCQAFLVVCVALFRFYRRENKYSAVYIYLARIFFSLECFFVASFVHQKKIESFKGRFFFWLSSRQEFCSSLYG